ncbi:MAG TPA: hypothetical protein VF832_16200 [Longimicrobiales bacterium]
MPSIPGGMRWIVAAAVALAYGGRIRRSEGAPPDQEDSTVQEERQAAERRARESSGT